MINSWLPRIGAIVLLIVFACGCANGGGARKLSRLERRVLETFGNLARVERQIELPSNPQSTEIDHASQKWLAAVEAEYQKASVTRDELRAQKSGTLRYGYLVGKAIAEAGLTESLLALAAPIFGESFLVDATSQQGGRLSGWLEWRLRYDHEFCTRYPALKAWADSRAQAGHL